MSKFHRNRKTPSPDRIYAVLETHRTSEWLKDRLPLDARPEGRFGKFIEIRQGKETTEVIIGPAPDDPISQMELIELGREIDGIVGDAKHIIRQKAIFTGDDLAGVSISDLANPNFLAGLMRKRGGL